MRILYVCNDLAYWQAHRAALAQRMAARGHDLRLITGGPVAAEATGRGGPAQAAPGHCEGVASGLAGAGAGAFPITVLPLPTQRLDPRRDLDFAREVRRAVRNWRPDVVHLITLKPILFGGAVVRLSRTPARVIATFAGLGRVFAEAGLRHRLVTRGLRHVLAGPRRVAVFENAADRDRLVADGIVPAGRTAIVRGAGFDPAAFAAVPLPAGPGQGAPLRLLFAARLLRAKGLPEALEAAQILAAEGAPVEVSVAGWAGDDPDAVPEAVLRDHDRRGVIRFLGRVPSADMPRLIAAHHLLVLPTRYPEGTPRILAEAGAVGRGAIVSDHPGCTTFVRDGREGVILDRADGPALAAAVRAVLRAPQRVAEMGVAAQRRALQDGFTIDAVAEDYARLYGAE